jgi:arylformamidase
VGTHVDAPFHFISGGDPVEAMPLDVLMGPAVVTYLPEVAAVTATDLEALDLPAGVQRLLLRTRNSKLWTTGVEEFQPDFVALTVDAAQWVVQRGIRLLGVDYLSVQRFDDGPEVHQILLEARVVIVEGLNLAGVEPGEYELICLPLKLTGAEGAPARAVLRKWNRKDSL